jgi:hypothetical protein
LSAETLIGYCPCLLLRLFARCVPCYLLCCCARVPGAAADAAGADVGLVVVLALLLLMQVEQYRTKALDDVRAFSEKYLSELNVFVDLDVMDNDRDKILDALQRGQIRLELLETCRQKLSCVGLVVVDVVVVVVVVAVVVMVQNPKACGMASRRWYLMLSLLHHTY